MTFPFIAKLPTLGTPETDTLEFKAKVEKVVGAKTADRFELAKDVAAFANAAGGTILIGAAGGSTLKKYLPLTVEDAKWVAREFDEAVRDRCAPPPTTTTQLFRRSNRVVLGVHVAPFPSPVAVKIHGNPKDGSGDPAWMFFRRVAAQNLSVRPEELPMLMLPQIRRIAILRSIPADAVTELFLYTHFNGRVDAMSVGRCIQVDVDEIGNSVSILRPGTPPNPNILHTYPLDRVRTVYRMANGIWRIEADE